MRSMKTLSTVLPLILLSYTTPSFATLTSNPIPSHEQTEDMAHHTDFMVELVGKSREANCHVPYTQPERERLTMSDPMVIVGAKLKQWVDPIEFPVFLKVINTTMHCDSAQWVNNMHQEVAKSIEFKRDMDERRKAVVH